MNSHPQGQLKCLTCGKGHGEFTMTRDPHTRVETTKYGNFCCMWCMQKAAIQEADRLEAVHKTNPDRVEEHIVKTPNGTLKYLTLKHAVVKHTTIHYKEHPVYVNMTASEKKLIVNEEDFNWFITITPGQQRSELMARSCDSPWHTQAPK